jgi:predicted RNase H-like HicB family nuclease
MVIEKKNKKDVNYYLNLPWTYSVETAYENDKVLYIVHVNELHCIGTDAYSLDEALSSIREIMSILFEGWLSEGEEIPEPMNEDQYKGNIAYRTSSRRHYLLAKEAKKRDQSLSQVLDFLIDDALDGKSMKR